MSVPIPTWMKSAPTLMALLIVACSDSATVTEPPILAEYTFDFPSASAAIATERVQAFVFNIASGTNPCHQLLYDRRTQSQGAPFATTPLVAPCDLVSGATRAAIELPFGDYAFLGIAQRDNEDLLIGCAVYKIDRDSRAATIGLTLASPLVRVPPTGCATLSDRCASLCE